MSGKPLIIDLRSDTVTKPTDSMKYAMVNSALGDDVYGEDPTVNMLESKVAVMFGKQAALFVPSGTMANLIAVMAQCNKRGAEILVGHNSHMFKYEQGSVSHLGGVMVTTLRNNSDGTFDLNEFEEHIRGSDIHEPITSLVCVENPHNMCGGKVLPLDWLNNLTALAKKHALAVHMDGARIFCAAEYLKVDVKQIVRDCDSVSLCFSKNLSAPAGSVLIGTYHMIDKARRLRKMLGGAMRQTGVLAAAAIVALDEIVPVLGLDHKRTQYLAKAINALNLKYFTIDVNNIQTNMFMINIDPSCKITAHIVIERLAFVSDSEIQNDCKTADDDSIIVRIISTDKKTLRVTLHHEITDELLWLAVAKFTFVLREFDRHAL